jgi:hypothetical protein
VFPRAAVKRERRLLLRPIRLAFFIGGFGGVKTLTPPPFLLPFLLGV